MKALLMHKDTLHFLLNLQNDILMKTESWPYFPLLIADTALPDKIESLEISYAEKTEGILNFVFLINGDVFKMKFGSVKKEFDEKILDAIVKDRLPLKIRVFKTGDVVLENNSWTISDEKFIKIK